MHYMDEQFPVIANLFADDHGDSLVRNASHNRIAAAETRKLVRAQTEVLKQSNATLKKELGEGLKDGHVRDEALAAAVNSLAQTLQTLVPEGVQKVNCTV